MSWNGSFKRRQPSSRGLISEVAYPTMAKGRSVASGSRTKGSSRSSSRNQSIRQTRQPAVGKSSSITPFQQRLYALCKCIPAGKVATYGTLAALLNSAARAVGQVRNGGLPYAQAFQLLDGLWTSAQPISHCDTHCRAAMLQGMRRNPFAPVVPCHRVIAASLDLGGFSGSWGLACENVQRKRRMLQEEGVPFTEAGRLASEDCLMTGEQLAEAAAAAGVEL